MRAWKLPSGGSKTYYLYNPAGQVLCELTSTGAPSNTYAYGTAGLVERYQATSGTPYVIYLFDPGGNVVHRIARDNVTQSGGRLVSDTAIYDGQGQLHSDIDVTSGGFEGNAPSGSEFDCVGYQGQSGAYTDLETVREASGLYLGLTAPGGLTTYYDPLRGLGFSRSQEAALNAYSQNLNPFAGWTFGAYASEAGQFGVGELKGTVNFVSGSVVVESPLLTIADDQLGGKFSSPVAAMGESQGDGADFIQVPLMVGAAAVGDPEEAAAAEGSAAVRAAGAESRLAARGGLPVGPGGAKMQRGFAMIGWKKSPKVPDDPHMYESYEQARNAALDWLGDDFRSEMPNPAKLPRNNPGPPNGMRTADGNSGFRVEYDTRSGAHINAWRGEEKSEHLKIRNGTSEMVKKIIRRFSR